MICKGCFLGWQLLKWVAKNSERHITTTILFFKENDSILIVAIFMAKSYLSCIRPVFLPLLQMSVL